jgi:hypothetical protein
MNNLIFKIMFRILEITKSILTTNLTDFPLNEKLNRIISWLLVENIIYKDKMNVLFKYNETYQISINCRKKRKLNILNQFANFKMRIASL